MTERNRRANEKEWKMMRWTSQLAVVFGAAAMLAVPGQALAGAMIKEHECVGKDTALSKSAEDAGCTPVGSVIAPPDNGLNMYDAGDVDEFGGENYAPSGALEVLPLGSNMHQTIPTIIETGFKQVGFPATFTYDIGLKSSSVLSDVEVVCSVCAMRPQALGPGQTYVPDDMTPAPEPIGGSGDFIAGLNVLQEPWRISASHTCGTANPLRGPGCGGPLQAKATPGLLRTLDTETTWMGCKPTIVQYDNRGQFFRGDIVRVRIDVPAAARLHANMDVTSCELSYIRGCLPGEGQFKDICQGEP